TRLLDQRTSQRHEHRSDRGAVFGPILRGLTPPVQDFCWLSHTIAWPSKPPISSRMKAFTPSRPVRRSHTGPPSPSTSTTKLKNGQQSFSSEINSVSFTNRSGPSVKRNA